MLFDLIEIECFCQSNNECFGCPVEDECFDAYYFKTFEALHTKEWIEWFSSIIYAEGE